MAGPLADPVALANRLDRVWEPHVAPLNRQVVQWRSLNATLRIPWFDPAGGGTAAKVLVLMESPGPRTVRPGGSMLCSEDNDDGTAMALAAARERTRLPRDAYVRWNIVPWAVCDDSGRPAAPKAPDLARAEPALSELLALLPELMLVVCMGAQAMSGFQRHLTLKVPSRVPLVLGVPHPSQRNAAARDESLRRIENALHVAARFTSDEP